MQTLDAMLAKSPWTLELQPEALQRVRATVVVRDLTPDSHVCKKGDAANAWIGVIDGPVKLVSVSRIGKSVTFAAVPAGSWFGEGSVLKREIRKYDVVALCDSRVALMPEATFFWLLDTSISFNRFILNQVASSGSACGTSAGQHVPSAALPWPRALHRAFTGRARPSCRCVTAKDQPGAARAGGGRAYQVRLSNAHGPGYRRLAAFR
jgi:CRP-like cAMP-binding protein